MRPRRQPRRGRVWRAQVQVAPIDDVTRGRARLAGERHRCRPAQMERVGMGSGGLQGGWLPGGSEPCSSQGEGREGRERVPASRCPRGPGPELHTRRQTVLFSYVKQGILGGTRAGHNTGVINRCNWFQAFSFTSRCPNPPRAPFCSTPEAINEVSKRCDCDSILPAIPPPLAPPLRPHLTAC